MTFADEAVGKVFGRLTVESIVRTPGRRLLKCKCSCGNDFTADPRMVKRGDTTSCGCYKKEMITKRCGADLVGQRFGRLTVECAGDGIEYATPGKLKKNLSWHCVCDCGERRELTSNALLSGNTKKASQNNLR